MTYTNITNARANLPSLVDKIEKEMERVVITVKGKPKVIMLSMEELESLEETAEILVIPGALGSIKRGSKQAEKRLGISLSQLR